MIDVSKVSTRARHVARSVMRLSACGAGPAVAIGLVLELIDPPTAPLFLASLGGSAVFLFGLTRAPAAQPRALFGGHIGGALIGALCAQFLGDAVWVYVVALVLPGMIHYPHRWFEASPPSVTWGGWVE
jgi:CBS-domain-containing membrane protein